MGLASWGKCLPWFGWTQLSISSAEQLLKLVVLNEGILSKMPFACACDLFQPRRFISQLNIWTKHLTNYDWENYSNFNFFRHNCKQYQLHLWSMAIIFPYIRTALQENKTSISTGQKKKKNLRPADACMKYNGRAPELHPDYFCHEIVFLIFFKDLGRHSVERHKLD